MTNGDKEQALTLVFVETGAGGWALQCTDLDGKIVVEGDGKTENLTPIPGLLADRRCVFVCWQVDRVMKDLGTNPFGNRAVIDLYQLAWLLVAIDEIKSRKLEAVAQWCNAHGKLDTPLNRVAVIRDCYIRLVARIKIGMQVEGFGRALASQATEAAMKMISKFGGAT